MPRLVSDALFVVVPRCGALIVGGGGTCHLGGFLL